MNNNRRRFTTPITRAGALWLLLGLLFSLAIPVRAQDAARIEIGTLQLDKFPEVGFYLETFDQQGSFIADLQPGELRLQENNQAREVLSLEKVEPGVQFIAALNLAPLMSNRVGDDSLYNQVMTALQGWLKTRPANTPDDYSLAVNTGLQVIRMGDAGQMLDMLGAFKPDILKSQPSLISLTLALDLSTDPNPNPLMKRTILYITPLPAPGSLDELSVLGKRASQLGVRVHVWLVGTAAAAGTPAGQALAQMAGETGGQFFSFTGTEQFPDIENYVQPLRSLYHVSYLSGVQSSGRQTLSVQVAREMFRSGTVTRSFDLTVLPPNPIFLSPPARVERTWVQPDSVKEEPYLEPDSVPIKILVEFEDGYPRTLTRAALLVDGQVVDENTREPFDTFDWPVASYQASGQHTLQVQVRDILGLEQSSIEMPVNVQVTERPSRGLWEVITPEQLALVVALISATSVLIAVLLISGRRGWRPLRRAQARRKKQNDPLTQPVTIQQERSRSRSAALAEATWPRTGVEVSAPAYLLRLTEDGQPQPGGSIPLNRAEITFGRDPRQAVCVLNLPAIEGLHARLIKTGEDQFTLRDAGSVAGTWVNYRMLNEEGVTLNHGDFVQIGPAAFRFELNSAQSFSRAVVTPYNEEE